MTHRHSNLLLTRKSVVLAVLVAVSALALLFAPVRGALTQAVYAVAPRVWSIGDSASNVWISFLTNFRIKRSLVYENEQLLVDIDRMQTQVLDRNLLEEKVLKLEEALGRAGSDNRVTASVLAGPGQSPYDTLVIDAGAEHGIAVGDVVVYAGAGAIGTIAEVSISSAKVKLYSSSGEEHLVLVGANALPATARGRGMGNFEAKVPQGSVVAVGDTILLPKDNLILGTVQLVEEKPAAPFIAVLFRTPFNIAEIRSVEVIKKTTNN